MSVFRSRQVRDVPCLLEDVASGRAAAASECLRLHASFVSAYSLVCEFPFSSFMLTPPTPGCLQRVVFKAIEAPGFKGFSLEQADKPLWRRGYLGLILLVEPM